MRKIAIAAGFAFGVFAGQAFAAHSIYVYQSGADVVASGSGPLNLTGLTPLAALQVAARTVPNIAQLIIGSAPPYSAYSGATGPASFGGGALAAATSSSGNPILLEGGSGVIAVPVGYVSGTPLISSATWSGATIASLGMNPGTYTYTWAGDSLTVYIGVQPPTGAPVPVPGLPPLALVGLAGLLTLFAIRRLRLPKT